MKNRLRSGLAGLLAFAAAFPAIAAVTSWSSTEGGRMRLAALEEMEPGKVTAILEIEPNAGWKTYWRDPGDAGLAPQIDLSAARNLRLIRIAYPAPEIGQDEGGRFVGYHRPVSLVLELEKSDPAEPSKLSANVLVGLCREICLPFQSAFELPLDKASQPVSGEFMSIQLAKAQLPEAPSSGFEVVQSGLNADKSLFEATIAVPDASTAEVAAAPSSGLLLGRQVQAADGKDRIIIRYPVARLPEKLDGAHIVLLVKSDGRAMETTLAIR